MVLGVSPLVTVQDYIYIPQIWILMLIFIFKSKFLNDIQILYSYYKLSNFTIYNGN